MTAPPGPSHALAALALALCALVLASCAAATSTTPFKGEQHEVAQTIVNLQADVTAAEQKKICTNDLASAVVQRLGGQSGCERAIKSQLAEIDSPEVTVKSVALAPGARSATASVKATREGKSSLQTVSLVKEAGKWKLATL